MGIDLSNNNAAYTALMEHAGHDINIGVSGEGAEVDIACETCQEILMSFSKPGECACERCGSPLYIEDGRCYDETCPFNRYPQGDPRGWNGYPSPPAPTDWYIIESPEERDDETGEPLYWNNDIGWVDRDSATRFSGKEVWDNPFCLPIQQCHWRSL